MKSYIKLVGIYTTETFEQENTYAFGAPTTDTIDTPETLKVIYQVALTETPTKDWKEYVKNAVENNGGKILNNNWFTLPKNKLGNLIGPLDYHFKKYKVGECIAHTSIFPGDF